MHCSVRLSTDLLFILDGPVTDTAAVNPRCRSVYLSLTNRKLSSIINEFNMAIATKFILILFGMPFALGETFTVTKCCRGHFDIASNECSNEIIGNDSTIDPFDGINKDLVISNYALIECLHPLEIKHATNSFEHQGFILHGGKLLAIEDGSIHEKFCLDQPNKKETNVLYCGLSLATICQDSICVRKCCPKNHVSYYKLD